MPLNTHSFIHSLIFSAPTPCAYTELDGLENAPATLTVSSNPASKLSIFDNGPWIASPTDTDVTVQFIITAPGEVTIVGFTVDLRHVIKVHATVLLNAAAVGPYKVVSLYPHS